MSSGTGRPAMRSAAWRISIWATLAFACGTTVVFVFLDRFVASDIQRRSDAWLSGEIQVLDDVTERTPGEARYPKFVGEIAELATREVPNRFPSESATNDSVFFLQIGVDGALKLWVGAGNGQANLRAIEKTVIVPDHPTDIRVNGFAAPFRVASDQMKDGSHIYLGLSERDELRVMRNLRIRFLLLSLTLVLLGFAMVFSTTRRVLSHVRGITEAASRIGHSDLNTRVPTSRRNDEIAHLALTLNRMLDRIENSMHQLHTITNSLAHDLRSPLTAIRGRLESALSGTRDGEQADSIASAIEELDRLTEFLNTSLDVAEANADALRLVPADVDLDQLLRAMIELYEPSMSERGLRVRFFSAGPVRIVADTGLMHRMIANLFDNELKHLMPNCTITAQLDQIGDKALFILEDNGRGFDPEVQAGLFTRRVKGKESAGHGLGLAFVDAVVRAHGGTVEAGNGDAGGVRIAIHLPLGQTGKLRAEPAVVSSQS